MSNEVAIYQGLIYERKTYIMTLKSKLEKERKQNHDSTVAVIQGYESRIYKCELEIKAFQLAIEQLKEKEWWLINIVILNGRLTADPDIKYSNNGDNQLCIARYTLAVDRRFKRDTEQGADFIRCKAFGRNGEFAEKYFTKGTKIAIDGRIQTGSYENKEGKKVYTTDIIVEHQEFAESKAAAERNIPQAKPTPEPKEPQPSTNDDFMQVPDDSGLPFNF